MKQFKQLAALFLAFVMVIGIMAVPTTAYADTKETAKSAISEAKVDYANEQITVTKTAEMKTIYYTDAYREDKTVWEQAYIVGDTSATIDISYTSASKDYEFYVTEDTSKTPVKVEVKAQQKDFAVALSPTAVTATGSKIGYNDWTEVNEMVIGKKGLSTWDYGFLTFTVGKGEDKKPLSKESVEKYVQFKKGAAGTWQSVAGLNLQKYAAKGAQIYFRLNGVVSGSAVVAGRASKEVRLSYTKQAAGPRVTIDGTTTKIALSKTQEYRISSDNGSSWGAWIKVADNHMTGKKVDTIYLEDLLTSTATNSAWKYKRNAANLKIQVRTAATATKIASKITTVSLNPATTPTISTSAGISFGLVKSTTYANGITVTNNAPSTGAAIQVAVVSGDTFDVNAKTTKWTTVKPGRTATIKGTVLETGDRIIYRTAAIKADAKKGIKFVVASEVGTLKKASYPALTVQTVTQGDVNATYDKGITVATKAAVTVSGDVFTLQIAKPASESAVETTFKLTTTNVADKVSPKVTCVEAANAEANTASDKKGVAISADKVQSNATTLIVKIGKGKDASTTTWKVVIDSVTKYIVVEYK